MLFNRRLFFRALAGVPAVPAIAAAASTPEKLPSSGIAIVRRYREAAGRGSADVINAALQQLGVLAPGERPTAEEFQACAFHFRSICRESPLATPSQHSVMLAARVASAYRPYLHDGRARPFYQYRHINGPAVIVEWNGECGCSSFVIARSAFGYDQILGIPYPTHPRELGERLAFTHTDEELYSGVWVGHETTQMRYGCATVAELITEGVQSMLDDQGREVTWTLRVA